jgi:hypothetical protein
VLKKFYRKKKLLPDLFTEKNRVNSIQGVYLPFWLFDAQVNARVSFTATKTSTWNKKGSGWRKDFTKTDYYSVTREGSIAFEKIPVDGSEKMDDAYMDAIEPFDYKGIKDFESAYLSGYVAEKHDVSAEESKKRAGNRIKNSVEEEFTRSVSGYASIKLNSSYADVKMGRMSYALFPVWILNTKYKNEKYMFLMNGQTGRLVGSLPIDKGKIIKYKIMLTAIFGAGFALVIQALLYFLTGGIR